MNKKEKKINFVVTGIGLVSPLGIGTEKNWARLINGESEVFFDKELEVYAAKIREIALPDNLRQLAIGFFAAQEAIKQSGINNAYLKERIGLSAGESKQNLFNKNLNIQESFSEALRRALQISGHMKSASAACATGALSVIQGCKMIEENICDAVICGTAETSIHPLYISAFKNMGVLSKTLPCPFDKERNGFAIGEGGGFLVVEEKSKAILRGAKPLCEIAGFSNGIFSDNSLSINSFDKMQKIIQNTVKNNTPDYIHMHGTGTKLNDYFESLAVKNSFFDTNKIHLSSTKASTGHLLGASAMAGAIFSIMAINKNIIPPTINFKETDIDKDLNFTPNKMVKKEVSLSLSLSFGFGGQGAALLFKKEGLHA